MLRTKYELGSLLGHHATVYYLWRKIFWQELTDRLISDQTEIVIEGFPRSGNTFAVAAFMLSQNRPVNIAHHSHKIAQVAIAVKAEIPALVIIRHPADAVVSLVLRYPFLSLSQSLNSYIRYYNGIYPYRDGYILSRFENIINDFGTEIIKLNRKFGTAFLPFSVNDENITNTFLLIEKMHREITGHGKVVETAIARPSLQRSKLNKQIKETLELENNKILCQAEDLFFRLSCD